MRLAKWGNSIALRIPAGMAEQLQLAPGVEVQARVTEQGALEITRDRRREEAIEKLRKLQFVLPEDYVFNRDELYDR
jgi:antitoxin MazE